MTSDNTPPHRLTTPVAFPDLDAALAASGIARKARVAPSRKAEDAEESVTDAAEPLIDAGDRSRPHPAAFAGAVLGLAVIGLLIFSVVRVSDDSTRTTTPMMSVPTSADAPTQVAATAPLAATPAVTPPTPDVAAPQLEAASPAASSPPPPPGPPAALIDASTVTAQTMVAKPPPQPEIAPQDSLRSLLHEHFPQLFPAP